MKDVPMCKRCDKIQATVVSRKEKFCDDCFLKFVSQKQRKQMMSDPYFQDVFKVMYQDRIRTAEEADSQNAQSNVLVALSFGSSSLVMLDILNDTLTEQKNTQQGKTGFQIDVVVCYHTLDEKEVFQELARKLWTTRYASNKEKLRVFLIGLDTFFDSSKDNLKTLVLDDKSFSTFEVDYDTKSSGAHSIEKLLSQCPDRSSREDLLAFIRTHLIKRFAFQNNHKTIVWGHSMTKVADDTISLIVKGRGAQIAPLIGSSKFDQDYLDKFKNLFPLRDVLLSEADAYCYISGLNDFLVDYVAQDTLLIQKINSPDEKTSQRLIKNMTINEIARKYFDDIEGDYSNVISTVVRTADKLAEPSTRMNAQKKQEKCSICLSKIHSDGSKWFVDITVNAGHPAENETELEIFEEWKKSEVGNEAQEYSNLRDHVSTHCENAPVCYGCMINLNRSSHRSLIWPKQSNSELDNVLNEFVLTDDEC